MFWALYDTEFQIDHIIVRQHGGRTVVWNLAFLVCAATFTRASTLLASTRSTGRLAPLFNPRRQRWERHFRCGPRVVGLTATGRATIIVLAMNDPVAVRIRAELIQRGVIPTRQIVKVRLSVRDVKKAAFMRPV